MTKLILIIHMDAHWRSANEESKSYFETFWSGSIQRIFAFDYIRQAFDIYINVQLAQRRYQLDVPRISVSW